MAGKFKVGDRVTVGDRAGEVVEARDGLYSVKVPALALPDGGDPDHEFDTLGAVPEGEIRGAEEE